MSRATATVQVSATRAAETVPARLEIGRSGLEVSPIAVGRDVRRFAARWSLGDARGSAAVEFRPISRSRAELVVTLEPRTAADRLFRAGRLRRLAARLAEALRYEVETRSAEESDAFAMRRTSPALVKQRSA